MRIDISAAFGLRMCLQCPDCNADNMFEGENCPSCSDYLGINNKSLGGYAGIATAMAFANEFQGDGTPHGHGFVALANIYQYSTLEQIGQALEDNIHKISPARMVERVTDFIEQLHREDHFSDDAHQHNIESLEEEFHCNNFGPPGNIHLSVRPEDISKAAGGSGSCGPARASECPDKDDACRFVQEYEEDVQLIFSHVQHHWHKLDKDGKRQPMQYCQSKRRGKKRCCKAGFPKRVLRHQTGRVLLNKYRARIVCAGVAK